MKKLLLSLATVLCCGWASAAETSYTIEFTTRADNNGAAIKADNYTNYITAESQQYVTGVGSTITSASNGMYGLKIGTNKGAGEVTFNLSEVAQVLPTKVEIKTSVNKNPSYQKFAFNGTAGPAYTADDVNDSYATFTFENFTETLTSVKFAKTEATAKNQGFIFVKSITVYYETAGPELEETALNFPEAAYTAEIGKDFESPVATADREGVITYISSDETIATVNAETGEVTIGETAGKTTITATIAATDTHKGATASYVLTVVDPNAPTTLFSFSNAKDQGFTYELVEGENQAWRYDAQYGLKGSLFVGGSIKPGVSIAVTDVIDLKNAKDIKLDFKNAFNNYKIGGNMIDPADFAGKYAFIVVRVVNNSTRAASEWEDLCEPTAPTAFSWTFYPNETVSLDDYTNKKIQIGFKYVATDDCAGTWEVNNVNVTAKIATGVEGVEVEENVEPVYYNLQGVRVANPEKGLYIVVKGNKSSKVMF